MVYIQGTRTTVLPVLTMLTPTFVHVNCDVRRFRHVLRPRLLKRFAVFFGRRFNGKLRTEDITQLRAVAVSST